MPTHLLTVIMRTAVCSMMSIVLFVAPLAARIAGNPFWTERAMFRFGEDLFFTGRATCAPSSEVGRQRAYNAAMQELLNYTRTKDVVGITIETQMIYEEPDSTTCSSGAVTVWRLLRAPAQALDRLNRAARQQAYESASLTDPSGTAKKIKDLTPRIGMDKDEAVDSYGQPKTVTMYRNGSEINWEYPRFGLTLGFDANGFLVRWKHVGPHSVQHGGSESPSRASRFAGLEGSAREEKSAHSGQEPIDLSKRLEKMQLESKGRDQEKDAERYCQRLYPRDRALQDSCAKYETDKSRSPLLSETMSRDAERAARVTCRYRWRHDSALAESCEQYERDRILSNSQGYRR